MTKKELLHLRRERDKLDRSLGGIKDMARTPSALWVVDTKKEHIAVSEARKLGIPVIAILDTNCDPDEVTYPIPGNDDAIRSVSLLTRVVADAVADGLIARAGASNGEDKPAAPGESGELGAEEPLAEWERELLEHQASAAAACPGGHRRGSPGRHRRRPSPRRPPPPRQPRRPPAAEAARPRQPLAAAEAAPEAPAAEAAPAELPPVDAATADVTAGDARRGRAGRPGGRGRRGASGGRR